VASPHVAEAARDCELLIHEAVNTRLMRNAIALPRDLANEVDARRGEGVIYREVDTIGVARMAAKAGAARLVLSQVTAGPDESASRSAVHLGHERALHRPDRAGVGLAALRPLVSL
jgi:hypothetical protein